MTAWNDRLVGLSEFWFTSAGMMIVLGSGGLTSLRALKPPSQEVVTGFDQVGT